MAKPDRKPEQRREFAPILARTFADLGYRRTTTAELATRCGVRENILYRLWPDKRAMFIAALDHVYEVSEKTWQGLLENADGTADPAELILEYESTHQGEFGFYRIVFAGLSETDDAEIAAALKRFYRRFMRLISGHVERHAAAASGSIDPVMATWAIIGLGTVANIGRELRLLSAEERTRLLDTVGHRLLAGEPSPD